MPIQFPCPSCGKSLKAPDTSAGQMARCPYCQSNVQVPEPGPEVVHEAESMPEGSAAAPPPVPGPRTSPEQAGDLQPCPACGEMIKANAVKCRFCGEILDPSLRRRDRPALGSGVELGAGDILFCIFCFPIAYIMSLVWILQDNPKGLKMFAMASLVATVIAFIFYCIVGINAGMNGARFR